MKVDTAIKESHFNFPKMYALLYMPDAISDYGNLSQ